ncbi:MAG: glycosyltransferase family 1 protein [Flexistipes sinusarabici]|uniref:Glycosyltransferase family 1 protein n=1 Tax=Flexistipes sinusarabici TaxID=2352 RepID=A0A5D0MHT0_FLESI|nr:glycosyltransferase [Flexistipes sinusarabici]TYB33264.1 MAG: glycosyltransferase family 1 protein [Flexistipes sinusarabici]
MKICDVTQLYSPISGGVKTYLSNKRSFFYKKEDFKHILIVPWHEKKVVEEDNLKTYYIKSPKLPFSESYRFFINLRKIYNIFNDEKPDIIENGDPYISGILALIAGRKNNVPVVGFYHSDIPGAIKRTVLKFLPSFCFYPFQFMILKYLKWFYSNMSITFVTNPDFKKYLENLGVDNVKLNPFEVDTEFFYPVNSRKKIFSKYGIPENARLLLYVGRTAREKNVSLLAPITELVTAFDVYIIIAGDGEQRRLVEQISRKNPKIKYIHYINDKEMLRELYSAADLFVHPGMSETFGLSLLEAQACGTECVAFEKSGLEYVTLNKNNLVKTFGTEPLAAKINEILENNIRKKSSNNIAVRVREKFGKGCFFENLVIEYENLLKAGKNSDLLTQQECEEGAP